jgi:CRP/FNR family cyclic AMP-dependent transcriptional regulator
MRRDQQLERIRAVPLFETLSKREVREILQAAREIEFLDGSVIVQEGSTGQDFYLILDGVVGVTAKGRRRARLGPGDYFGEIALIAGGPRTATVTAATRVWTLRLDSASFFAILDRMPTVARKILVEVCRRLGDARHSPTN